jgi:nitroimidazol reductase NimA-like FMN-containing flavoprotein (pyridoxamine 5'-phosphate oxidase superfamily)
MSAPIGEPPDMAAYGVGSPDWRALPWEWAAERLSANHNYWVVTVSSRGAPSAMPVWGVWDDGDKRFMFACAPTARKVRNIAANPNVVFTVDNTTECISVEGTAAALTDPTRVDAWVDRYVAKYGPESPEGLGDFVRQHAMFEVTPKVAFAIIEREAEFANRATRWRFVTG